jgi:hypothetical protein
MLSGANFTRALPSHAPLRIQVCLKSGSNEGHFTERNDSAFASRIPFVLGDSKNTRRTPSPSATKNPNLVEIGQQRRGLYFEGPNSFSPLSRFGLELSHSNAMDVSHSYCETSLPKSDEIGQ